MDVIEEKQGINENDKKKEYLRGYQKHVRRIDRIEMELKELREIRTSVSVNNDGMPHGSGQSDLSDYAAKLDEMERELKEERFQRIKAYKGIAHRVKALHSENEKDVLFYRYIVGLDWWEIADRMKYSERWVHKIHGKALAHFQPPKKEKSS